MECRLQETNLTSSGGGGGASGNPVIVAGSSNGEIKAFDMRNLGGGMLGSASLGQPISALAIHQNAPLFAAWTRNQQTVLVNLFKKQQQTRDGAMNHVQLNVIKRA